MIRTADKKDLQAVSVLWVAMVFEARSEWEPDPEKWIAMASALFDSGIYYLLVYEQDSKIVGFIDGMIFPEPATGKVHGVAQHFYVSPEFRKTGISGKLYEEILYTGLMNGVELMELFCFPEMEDYWAERGFTKERILMRRQINV